MKDGLRKVVHVEVFDFESDVMAYALNTKKNQFGYKYTTEYRVGDKIAKVDPEVNNVKKGAYYNRVLGLNLSQLTSLRHLIKRVVGSRSMFPFPEEDGSVRVMVRGGSTITYRGDNQEEFFQKVLKLK